MGPAAQVYLAAYALVCLLADWLGGLVARASRNAPAASRPEGVTMVRPIGGGTRLSEDCLRSFAGQRYDGELQCVAVLQDPKDPSLPLVHRVAAETSLEFLIRPRRDGWTGKTSNLAAGVEAAAHEILVFSDSDAWLPPNTVARLVGVLQSGAKLACCLPLHTRAENTWARVFALARNSAMLHLWGPSVLLGRPAGAVGTTLAVRKADLAELGGISAFKAFVPEDLPLGRAARERGWKVALGPPVYCPLGQVGARELFERLERAAMLVLTQAPAGKAGGLAVFVLGGAYLPLLAWGALGGDASIALFAAFVAAAKALAFWRMGAHAPGVFAKPWDFLLLDVLYAAAFLGALSGGRATWGAFKYRLEKDGRISD